MEGVKNLIYIQHKRVKDKYLRALNYYNELLDKKEILFIKSQNLKTNYNSDNNKKTNKDSIEENYVESIEKLDKSILIAKDIYESRKALLHVKEEEVKKSQNWYDIFYVAYYIENKSIKTIARTMPYSRRQLYNIKKEIDKKI